MSIAKYRDMQTKSRKWLDRARWKYAAMIRNKVKDGDYRVLKLAAIKAQDRGLYSRTTYLSDVQTGILRKFKRIDGFDYEGGWHDWCALTGWRFGSIDGKRNTA